MGWGCAAVWCGRCGPVSASNVEIQIAVKSPYTELQIRVVADAASKEQVADAVRQASATVADMIAPRRPKTRGVREADR